jgi:hypothetical protein
VTAAVFYSLDELADNGFGGGKVRISHAEVNDIFTGSPSLNLEGIDNGEDIGRQPLNPAKFVHLLQSFHKNNVMLKILYSSCFVKVQGLEDDFLRNQSWQGRLAHCPVSNSPFLISPCNSRQKCYKCQYCTLIIKNNTLMSSMED